MSPEHVQETLFAALRPQKNDEPVDARQRRLNRERQMRFRQRRARANAALWAEAEQRGTDGR